MQQSLRPILYFDGVCNLCNGAVQWVIRRDKQQQFLFAPLQSEAGALAMNAMGQNLDSIILFHHGQYFTKSNAALRIASLLGGRWAWLAALRIFPKVVRDAVYDLVARNRYRWFGKKNACMIPTPALQRRFISDAGAQVA